MQSGDKKGSKGEGGARAAQESSNGILRFYTDEAPGFQMLVSFSYKHFFS